MKDFTSTNSQNTLKADEKVAISFSFIGSGNINHIVAYLADVKFSQKNYVYQNSLTVKAITAYLNPATDMFKCKFISDKTAKLTLQVVVLGT